MSDIRIETYDGTIVIRMIPGLLPHIHITTPSHNTISLPWDDMRAVACAVIGMTSAMKDEQQET